jgi:hypothetical protein
VPVSAGTLPLGHMPSSLTIAHTTDTYGVQFGTDGTWQGLTPAGGAMVAGLVGSYMDSNVTFSGTPTSLCASNSDEHRTQKWKPVWVNSMLKQNAEAAAPIPSKSAAPARKS